MSEMSFEQMLEESFKTIHNGEVVDGTVISVKPDEIVLNIGYKSVGDPLSAIVIKVNDGEGQVLLSYKRLAQEKGNERLAEAFEKGEVLTATVDKVLKGGLTVVVDEARVFIPASFVSDVYEKDLTKYQGQEISFVITEFDPKRRRIIGNRKTILVADKAKAQEELMAKIAVGQ